MRNIKITIEYDGSRYQGWTRLGKDESNNTISAKIIDVLGKMTGEKNIELNCGCRTEVGVHAYAQVANFKTSSNLSTKDIQHYLNRYLPMDIAITEVEEVPDRFHAQLNAVSKTYVYRMTIMDVPSVFERKHTYHCFKTPDKKAMQQAALLFIGEHDFRNFSTAKKSKNTTREVYDIDIYPAEYDAIFPQGHDADDANIMAMLCFDRLRWPWQLSETAAGHYRAFLSANTGRVLARLLKAQDTDSIRALLALDVLDKAAFAEGAALAAKAENAAAAALLADAEHKKFAAAKPKRRYDFDF